MQSPLEQASSVLHQCPFATVSKGGEAFRVNQAASRDTCRNCARLSRTGFAAALPGFLACVFDPGTPNTADAQCLEVVPDIKLLSHTKKL